MLASLNFEPWRLDHVFGCRDYVEGVSKRPKDGVRDMEQVVLPLLVVEPQGDVNNLHGSPLGKRVVGFPRSTFVQLIHIS